MDIPIPLSAIDGISTVGVVLIVGWLIVSGRLVPRRTHDDVVHEANEWRTEARIKDQQITVKDEQLAHLAEVGRTVDAIMRAVQTAGRGGGTS